MLYVGRMQQRFKALMLFCLDAHRIIDLTAFPVQFVENEALTWLIMAQT